MMNKHNLIIYEEVSFFPGKDTFVDSTADNNNAVVFEDNEVTGYFYAMDRTNDDEILDGLHIYIMSTMSPIKIKYPHCRFYGARMKL